VLRNEAAVIERGSARVRVAGVDDTWTRKANLDTALASKDDLRTILLAHDPDLFLEAAARGADVVLAGHTHAGQVGVPFVRRWSLASLTHRHHAGLYREGDASLYVHAGLGTTGPPLRFGAAPEIAVLVLRAA
jgi:hypothetical protein